MIKTTALIVALTLACAVGYQTSNVTAALRITRAEPDPEHPKDFDSAIRHLNAVPGKGFMIHELASAYALALEAQRDRAEDFQNFTPEQHYLAAIYRCHHQPTPPGQFLSRGTDCIMEPSAIAGAIRHLESIPPTSQPHEDASKAMRLLRLQIDRPQEFEAARSAEFDRCAVGVHDTMDLCDLFNLARANNYVIATYMPGTR
jgi:hypothetical protein